MLKRQRPSTPPPSLAETSSFSEFVEGEPSGLEHSTKRRRIVAPSLDGRQRGMNTVDYDNGEEYLEEEGHIEQIAHDVQTESTPSWVEPVAHYKYSNALLHQLHLEHQRRVLLQTTSSLAPSGNHSDTLRNSHAQYSQSSKVHTHVEPPVYYPNELYAPSLAPIGHGPGHDSDMVLESLRVRAIYEGSNRCVERYLLTTGTLLIFTLSFRLLGSLVKQRLREQESSSN